MNRRIVLLGVAGLAVASGLGMHVSEDDAVAEILFKRLSYLRLDEEGIRQFARDYTARHLISAGKLRALALAGPLYVWLPAGGNGLLTRDIRHGEERIVTTFLLSTDFFQNGADERRPVRYVGLHDPLRCGNPFARPVAQNSRS
jgi:hypothetical protein